VSKDRARPFSRKHRRYWIPVTGGMILIGVINVAIGFCSYEEPSELHEKIEYALPVKDAGVTVLDAGSATSAPVDPAKTAPDAAVSK
jgi:hypothetical protein